jgi:hypothetical protein
MGLLLEHSASAECNAEIQRLLLAAAKEEQERRDSQRHPFFTRVTLRVPGEGTRVRLSCFSRDVSEGGIGLLHHFPVIPGDVTVEIHVKEAKPVTLAGELVWCEPAGDGCYLSGVRFAR